MRIGVAEEVMVFFIGSYFEGEGRTNIDLPQWKD